MRRKMVLVDKGKEKLIAGTLRSDPFSDEMMGMTYVARKGELAPRTRDEDLTTICHHIRDQKYHNL